MTNDMTRGSPTKLILLFTIPLLLGNIFQQFYSMADTMIVGRTISADALGAVGCTGPLSFLIIGFAQGLTSGFAVVTAQRFGAGDYEGVRKSVTSSAFLSLILTVLLTLGSVFGARPLLELMQTPDNLIDDAYRYIVVIFGGIGTSMLFNLLSNIIRALGDSKTPLLFLAVACVINIALDFAFILIFQLGVAGAGWATVIAQLISGLLCLLYIAKRFPVLWLKKDDWQLDGHRLLAHARVGLPMGFQTSIIAIGSITLQGTLNTFGSLYVSSFTAAQKIDQLATQPLMSFGITMATYTAQNYGAGNISRIKKGVNRCILISLSISLAGGAAIILAGYALVGLFVPDSPQIVELAQVYLRITTACYSLLALLFIFRYTLQGLGRSLIPTVAGIVELVMRTMAAVVLARLLDFTGVCMASPVAWLGALIPLSIAYFVTIHKLRDFTPQPAQPLAPDSQTVMPAGSGPVSPSECVPAVPDQETVQNTVK